MAGHWHPRSCKVCGARRPWVHVSATGLCPEHSRQRMTRNLISLHEKRGPDFEKWLQGIARGVVAVARETRGVDAQADEG